MSARRLPTECEAADALLAQALARGHYVKTPADEECPAGVWMLVPLDRRLARILELAGQAWADLEDDEREPDVDDEPSLGATIDCPPQEQWSAGIAGRVEVDQEQDDAENEPSAPGASLTLLPYVHPELGRFTRL